MCGRYTLAYEDFSFMLEYYGLASNTDFSYPSRYNIAPGQEVPAIIHDGQARRIGLLRWGLIPAWADNQKIGFKTINARAETVCERPSFKRLVDRKRCLIPADGFYEWKQTGGTGERSAAKQPMRIVLKSRRFFSFAGLYDTWLAPTGEKISTFTIITVRPNELMASIHDRMPAILQREDEEEWVHRSVRNSSEVKKLLYSYPAGDMTAYPVSTAVGNVSHDVPECIREVH